MATPAENMWENFVTRNNIENATFQTRWFGSQDNPDEIDQMNTLILRGDKQATSKPLAYYAAEQDAVPQPGDYFVILNGEMKPVAIIQTVVSELVPFLKISAEHAYHEAQGDRTLTDWQERSLVEFKQLMQQYDAEFTEEDPIVAETFKVVYRGS